jgi:hypothetical protein
MGPNLPISYRPLTNFRLAFKVYLNSQGLYCQPNNSVMLDELKFSIYRYRVQNVFIIKLTRERVVYIPK